MITEEEENEIIEKVAVIVEAKMMNMTVEKLLLSIPEVVGNMMTQHVSLNRLNAKLYSDYPEFVKHKDAARSIIEKVESKNPLAKYEDILKEAVPEIRERINTLKKLDMGNVSTSPNRQFEKIESPKIDSHGKL